MVECVIKNKTLKKLNTLKTRIEDAKPDTDQSIIIINAFFKSEGWNVLGDGCFATCWGKPKTKFVIKVFDSCEDECYYDFITEVQKIKSDYVPKVYSIIEIGNVCLVVMEKLISHDFLSLRKYRKIMKDYFDIDIESEFGYLPSQMHRYIRESDKHNELHNIVKIIVKIRESGGGLLDLHEDNIMYRKHGASYIPIIIDPLCPN